MLGRPKDMYTTALHMSEYRFHADKISRIDREAGRKLLEQANADRTIRWETMLLLGDSATVAAGRTWRDAVYEVVAFSFHSTDGNSPAEWQSLIRNVDVARENFYVAARGSLDIRGGSVEQAPWRLLSE
jgi:hypothetical protein